ncbi:MAG: C40 family peptidase [Lachnospiraceae bacterium]|nr:C40 family peptidase [Lachnospiraceae bacterium]
MFRKYTKVVAAICAAAVVISATSTMAMAGSFGLPTVGAATVIDSTPAVDNTSETTTTTTAELISTEPVQQSTEGSSVELISLAVGEAANDQFTMVHTATDVAPVVDTPAVEESIVEETVEVIPEETVSENSMEEDFSNLVIAQVNDYVNVRSMPSEEGEILGKLYDDSVGEFISEQDGWYEIKSGSVQGFVKAEYVVTGDEAVALAKEVGKRIATVNTTTLFVREEATTESSVVGMVPLEDELSVTEEGVTEGWIKVSIEEGEGYVSTEFVELSTEFVKAESKAEEEARLEAEAAARRKANAAASSSAASESGAVVSGGSGTGNAVASYALQFVGNPYVYGGTSLTNGADCSGFVMAVYSHFGVGLPHSSGAQRGCGYSVGGLANAQPGDIVCYSGHVGIYIGNGQIVHASTAATGIKVSNASYRQVLSVRRIF